MKKTCTDIKQSNKLIELGIDINTADMFWLNANYDEYLQCLTPFVCGDDTLDLSLDIPAWSLSALMEFMNRNGYSISLNCNGALWTIKFDDSKTHHYITCYYSIDAAFEMVVWLKENNKI